MIVLSLCMYVDNNPNRSQQIIIEYEQRKSSSYSHYHQDKLNKS